VVTVYDLGQDRAGTLYLVMELLAGRDLSAVLRHDGPPAIADAVAWTAQTADALQQGRAPAMSAAPVPSRSLAAVASRHAHHRECRRDVSGGLWGSGVARHNEDRAKYKPGERQRHAAPIQ
jgi:serine/threonine protein kinase